MRNLIPQLVDYHAAATPQADAILFLDQKINYSELRDLSNQLANCLIDRKVLAGDRVGIYMDKCLEVAVAMYGIMKAGAAYVPLDPSAPATRIAEIIDDCGISVVVSAENKRNRIIQVADLISHSPLVVGMPPDDVNALEMVSWESVYQEYSNAAPDTRIIESDLAYIIYTSGSTGKPKGIMHTHHSGLSFARWAAQEYQLASTDRLSNHAPLHFDLSIFDFFAGAVAGASTAIIPGEYTRLPASYSQLLADWGITVMFTVPFALIQLLLRGVLNERDLGALRWVIFGGEPFPVKYLHSLMQLLPGARFDNMYGPTEVNGCSHYTVTALQPSDPAIPIGRISQISEMMVVDDDSRPVSRGDAGELLVRTPTMMQGYWERPKLNANAFYRRVITSDYHQVFYRTGDLVRLDSDGMMWFLGRKDRQVKVRGYRIELDEIEAALVKHEDIEEAAAFTVRTAEGLVEIQAAITLVREPVSMAEISAYLKKRLPAYAIPGVLRPVAVFPRTSTGKIDRRALTREATDEPE